MPGYIKGYQMNWKSMKDAQTMTLLIHDTTSGTPGLTANYTELRPATSDPVSFSVVSGEDKLNSVYSTRCTIQYQSDINLPFSTFSSGSDERFLVEVLAGSGAQVLFTGFLILNVAQAPFLPHPQIITLTATDNLKTLNKVDLTNDSVVNPRGNYRLLQYLSWCFKKTGLFLPIKVVCSLMEGGNGINQTSAIFDGTNQWISVPENLDNIRYFRAGKQISISGTTLNNGTSTITSVTNPGGNLLVTLSVTIITETPGTATFTDIDPCALSNLYVDAKTFEKEINVSEDCATVVSKIVSAFAGFVKQHNGAWWIFCIDDFRWDNTRIYNYDENGAFISFTTTAVNRNKEIGPPDTYNIWFRDAATIVGIERKKLFAKLIYRYQNWREILCNNDMGRGNFIADLSDVVENGITYQRKSYDFECWTYEKINAVNDSTSYVIKYFYNGYEKQRFLRLLTTATSNTYFWRLTDRIPVELKDKFNLSFSTRYSTDLGGGSGHFTVTHAWIRLYGNDGTFWNLRFHFGENIPSSNQGNLWVQSNSTWSTGTEFIVQEGELQNIDFTQWQDVDFESAPVPVSGTLEILLLHANFSNTADKDFTSLRFDYLPLINGSYQKYPGEYNKFSAGGVYKDSIEQEVFLCDSPRKLFKGALKYLNGLDDTDETLFALASQFYNFSDGTTGGFGYDRFAKYMANQIWNQYRNEVSVFQSHLQGLETTGTLPEIPDIIHKYFIRDISAESNDRYFMITSLQRQNLRVCNWEVTLMEVYNTVNGYEYNSANYEFKYLTG